MGDFQRETTKRFVLALAFFLLCIVGELISQSDQSFIPYFGGFIFVLGMTGYLFALFSKAFAWRLTKLAFGYKIEDKPATGGYSLRPR